MKRIITLIFSLVALCTAVYGAGKPAVTYGSTTHDFGTISAAKGPVSAEYEFTNTGDAPLIIINVTNGGCGCTTPAFPKQPIAPGKSGVITIHFDPTGRKGEFNREVKVRTNIGKKQYRLKFSGVIVP